MWPILHGLDRRLFVKLATFLMVAFSLLPAEPADSLLLQMTAAQDSVTTVQDSTTAQDSTLAAPVDTLSSDTSKNCFSVDLSTGEINPSDSDKSGLETATPSARDDALGSASGKISAQWMFLSLRLWPITSRGLSPMSRRLWYRCHVMLKQVPPPIQVSISFWSLSSRLRAAVALPVDSRRMIFVRFSYVTFESLLHRSRIFCQRAGSIYVNIGF